MFGICGLKRVATIVGSCFAISCGDGPGGQDCLCGTLVNLCRNGAVVGARLGQATNTLAPAPSDVTVAIAQDGEMRVLGMDGMDIVAEIEVSKCGDVTGTVAAFSQPALTFATGDVQTTGTILGKLEFDPLTVRWELSSGDSGRLDADIARDVFTGADNDDIRGNWLSVDKEGVITGTLEVDDSGDLLGQTLAGCVREGSVIADGSNILNIALQVSACEIENGEYIGLGVTERSAVGSADASNVGAIGVHVNRPDRVLVERWIRP